MKYQFFTDGKKKVICVSHYAGKTVRGVAICQDSDEFDLEFGKQLAQARCDFKVAEKRYKNSVNKLDKAVVDCNKAASRVQKMNSYREDAQDALHAATDYLVEIELCAKNNK